MVEWWNDGAGGRDCLSAVDVFAEVDGVPIDIWARTTSYSWSNSAAVSA